MAYLPLSTANLPDPVIDPAQGSSPEDYFNTLTWSGDGSDPRTLTGVGFQPDFVWVKNRTSGSIGHYLWDAVRGTDKNLRSDGTFDEAAVSGASGGIVSTSASDGFTVKGNLNLNNVNLSGESYVAWNWKANGSGVSNTDGSITSTVSANTTSGFSVVSYTGTAANSTVGHGLDSAPEMFILKNRDATGDWYVYHSALGATKNLRLNLTSGAYTTSNLFNDTEPTSTTFSLGFSAGSNGSGNDYIAYCFHSVEGFSKFGSYVGNGSNDGPMIFTGFKPSFFMWKRTDSGSHWGMSDNGRNTYNVVNYQLLANDSGSDLTNIMNVDFLSNGIKVRDSDNGLNASGGSFIYMAFAENPFKYSNAR